MYHCIANQLELAIDDSILSQCAVIDILALVQTIVSKFRHSILAQENLDELQKRMNMPAKRLV